MPTASVLLAPPLPGHPAVLDRPAAAAALRGLDVRTVAPPDQDGVESAARPADEARRQWVRDVALHMWQSGAPAPTLVVLAGPAAALAPELAFALAAARRAVCGYALIAGSPEPGTPQWPEAPVAVLDPDDELARSARLRGWEVLRGAAPDLIRQLATRP